jgi:hypothetical protein
MERKLKNTDARINTGASANPDISDVLESYVEMFQDDETAN